MPDSVHFSESGFCDINLFKEFLSEFIEFKMEICSCRILNKSEEIEIMFM